MRSRKSKSNSRFNKWTVLSSVFAFFFVFLTFSKSNVYAGTSVEIVCDADRSIFRKVLEAFDGLDVRQTGVNMGQVFIVDLTTHIVANQSIKEVGRCGVSEAVQEGILDSVPDGCEIGDIVCDDRPTIYTVDPTDSGAVYEEPRMAGSLLGVARNLEAVQRTEPIPVHYAYWIEDKAENVPFTDGALAATFSGPFLGDTDDTSNVILNVWKFSRDVAFGLMSIVMVVTGIMIITGKKLDPRVTVTVQTALPRIILSLALIAFTYGIGGALASVSWGLGFSIENTIESYLGNNVTDAGAFNIISLFVLTMAASLGITGIGLAGVILIIIPSIVLIILFVIAQIKVFIVYLKIIIGIIWSPIALAIGAIPGREDVIKNLVNSMAAHLVTIPLMKATIIITIYTTRALLVSQPSLGDAIWALIYAPLIAIFGFYYAIKIPGKVESAFMGRRR